ncbi:glyoxylase-like metal-dependent hydrolase (beta-lactamase superfamily II) [Marinobacterium halophilum]|uniref:Glyoxylase-like metal-dependent hydrolase (Beta-lactamase superfamily II) n=1 Tax=Marinobacterium halophilum TaxID=267374 RepID=A0A2P8ERH1_9GAMM|nr:MBL fold metallo-hydrolase [Marinobacterium halophilum]PSL12077.1 glyoxylase-like metal-dependent hydrolase (beta-lactamase superfamily II) [Marinobacterium halophilum]
MHPIVTAFFDEPTFTYSYIVQDPASSSCAIIDSVLDFDYAAGRTGTGSADAILAHVAAQQLNVEWILETHVHADHLSAAPYLQQKTAARIGIGAHITTVQDTFGKAFNAGTDFARDGSQFDALFHDGDAIRIGNLEGKALHTPGHTPACMTYVFGDAAFVGDTLFMPDYGTARCDFPGGDARILYRSIQRVFELPDTTRLFMCHDYKAPGRDVYAYETTVAEERAHNVHVKACISEEDFVRMRTERDATLGMPRLILPSVQVNMRAGQMPPAEDNGQRYLKIPIDLF